MPKDNTDGPEGRSGLVISTDHLTGCQYLSLPLRSITPRLDETGKPICGKSAAPKGEPKP